MPGPKTNERPGTRATLRGYHMSASKARVVLNLIRGEDVTTAREILVGTSREAADVIAKVLASAVANAVNNDGQSADELYVSAAFADEGITMKRFTPRARGRAGKIRKRACHITVIVSRLDDERLEVLRASRSAAATASRARRVASSRRASGGVRRVARPPPRSRHRRADAVSDQVEVDQVDTVRSRSARPTPRSARSRPAEADDEDTTSVEETDEGASSDAPEETGE